MKDLEKRLSIIEEKLGIVKELEVGKWYKLLENGSIAFLGGKDTFTYGISMNEGHTWIGYNTSIDNPSGWIEATKEEVQEALINEANRRCLEGEFSIKEPIRNDFSRIVSIGGTYSYNDDSDTLFYGGVAIYHKGKWAEKVEHPTDKFAELKEAERNGYVIECRANKVGTQWVLKTHEMFVDCFEYRIKPQQSSLEQDIQQLKDKYKQYKFTITIEDNV